MATTPQQHPTPNPPGPPASALDLVVHNSLLESMWQSYLQRITPVGRWLLVPTFFFGLWGATSLDHQVHIAFLYVFSLWLVAAVCLPLARPAVRLTAHVADRIGAGETLTVDLDVTRVGHRRTPDVFIVAHQLPTGIEMVVPQGVAVPMSPTGEAVRVTLGLRCPRRGVYELPGFRVCSDFPFGLLCAYRVFGPTRPLLVFPHFVPLARLTIAPGRRYHPGGVALASNLGDTLEFIGSRPFREGDNVRDIDWSATARLDSLIVREYRQEYFHRVAVILDTFVPRGDEARDADFERAVCLAASVSDYMARQEYLVDLFAAGTDVYHLTAGRSLAYVDEILEILACVRSSPRETFTTLEPEIGEHLAQITTVVCLFLDWDEKRRAFAERLSADGASLKVIVVRDVPPTLDPSNAPTGWGPIPVLRQDDFAGELQIL
jgi:uncharacterized protein (DUF58 family)